MKSSLQNQIRHICKMKNIIKLNLTWYENEKLNEIKIDKISQASGYMDLGKAQPL